MKENIGGGINLSISSIFIKSYHLIDFTSTSAPWTPTLFFGLCQPLQLWGCPGFSWYNFAHLCFVCVKGYVKQVWNLIACSDLKKLPQSVSTSHRTTHPWKFSRCVLAFPLLVVASHSFLSSAIDLIFDLPYDGLDCHAIQVDKVLHLHSRVQPIPNLLLEHRALPPPTLARTNRNMVFTI